MGNQMHQECIEEISDVYNDNDNENENQRRQIAEEGAMYVRIYNSEPPILSEFPRDILYASPKQIKRVATKMLKRSKIIKFVALLNPAWHFEVRCIIHDVIIRIAVSSNHLCLRISDERIAEIINNFPEKTIIEIPRVDQVNNRTSIEMHAIMVLHPEIYNVSIYVNGNTIYVNYSR